MEEVPDMGRKRKDAEPEGDEEQRSGGRLKLVIDTRCNRSLCPAVVFGQTEPTQWTLTSPVDTGAPTLIPPF